MSSACSKLRRVWENTNTYSATGMPLRPTQPIINELYKEPNLEVLVAKFKHLSASFYFRSKYAVYIYTIGRLAAHKHFSAIEEIIEAHKKYEDITRESYAARLMSLYGNAGMFEHAHNMFDELPKLKCQRTSISLSSLMGAALHSKKSGTSVEIFQKYPSELGIVPSVSTYNSVIRALGELGLVDDAIAMVDEMEMKGLEPDVITFNSLVNGAYGKKGYSEGEEVWHMMLEKRGDMVPDILSYNAKLQGMINQGMVFDAVDLFLELRKKRLDPIPATYNHLIQGFCDHSDIEEAKKWYMRLVDGGWYPNGGTFQALIRPLCENGDSGLAFNLSKRMFGRYFLVDQDLLQMVVDTLVKDLKVEEAMNLVKLARSNCFYQYNLVMPSEK